MIVTVLVVTAVPAMDGAPGCRCLVWQLLLLHDVAGAQVEAVARSASLLVATAGGHGGEGGALLAPSVVVAVASLGRLLLLSFVFDPRHKPTGQLNTDFCVFIGRNMTR